MSNAATILTTVNAPYSYKMSAQELALCLKDAALAKTYPGHMSSFFGEVKPVLQIAFAHMFNVSDDDLKSSAKAFAAYSGETYPLAA